VISNYLLLITFTGRKSGKTYTTPVSYSQEDDVVTIFTHANWWKNLRRDTPITLHLRGRARQGLPQVVAEDQAAVAAALSAHLRKAPFDARFYDVTMDEAGEPDAADVQKAVETVVMIRVQLC
jgi:deazaflavin-dependent oxidoreductase (nitroreductase family)